MINEHFSSQENITYICCDDGDWSDQDKENNDNSPASQPLKWINYTHSVYSLG